MLTTVSFGLVAYHHLDAVEIMEPVVLAVCQGILVHIKGIGGHYTVPVSNLIAETSLQLLGECIIVEIKEGIL